MLMALSVMHCTSSPRDAAPAWPRLPRTQVTLLDRTAWRGVLSWPDDCEASFQASRASEDGGLEFADVGERVSVVAVLCAAGSYQPSHVFVRLDERARLPLVSLLSFSVYTSEDGTTLTRSDATEIWGEPTLSADTKELRVLALARQTGDCGVWTRYDIGSDAPRLLEARARQPCPDTPETPAFGAPGEPPEGWAPVAR